MQSLHHEQAAAENYAGSSMYGAQVAISRTTTGSFGSTPAVALYSAAQPWSS
jgi:hypothetical protein